MRRSSPNGEVKLFEWFIIGSMLIIALNIRSCRMEKIGKSCDELCGGRSSTVSHFWIVTCLCGPEEHRHNP